MLFDDLGIPYTPPASQEEEEEEGSRFAAPPIQYRSHPNLTEIGTKTGSHGNRRMKFHY